VKVVEAPDGPPDRTHRRGAHLCVTHLRTSEPVAHGSYPRKDHKSIAVTIDVYGHLFPSLNEALAERLDEVFRRAAITGEGPAPTIQALADTRLSLARP
ncbi:MAG: hypothetical protein ACRD1K_12760, partial [Acidimicrobiales bacterium]